MWPNSCGNRRIIHASSRSHSTPAWVPRTCVPAGASCIMQVAFNRRTQLYTATITPSRKGFSRHPVRGFALDACGTPPLIAPSASNRPGGVMVVAEHPGCDGGCSATAGPSMGSERWACGFQCPHGHRAADCDVSAVAGAGSTGHRRPQESRRSRTRPPRERVPGASCRQVRPVHACPTARATRSAWLPP